MRSAALEGSEQPPFQQGNDQVNARKQRLASLSKVLNFSIMDIAIEFPVGVQTVRANRASQLNIILNEAVERFSIKVLDKGHTDAPDPFAIGFCGNDDLHFA